jgi:hypothetical protein
LNDITYLKKLKIPSYLGRRIIGRWFMGEFIKVKINDRRMKSQKDMEQMNRLPQEEGSVKENVQKGICAWCNKVIRNGGEPATHGICPKCLVQEMGRYCEA